MSDVFPVAAAPLTNLSHAKREQVIATITTRLPHSEAIAVLTALAGSAEERAAVPFVVQVRGREAIMDSLPPGINAIVVSTLSIGLKSDSEYLEEVLTVDEKTDPLFQLQVEEEAQRRGIQRWLAAVKLRHKYTVESVRRALGRPEPAGTVTPAPERTESFSTGAPVPTFSASQWCGSRRDGGGSRPGTAAGALSGAASKRCGTCAAGRTGRKRTSTSVTRLPNARSPSAVSPSWIRSTGTSRSSRPRCRTEILAPRPCTAA